MILRAWIFLLLLPYAHAQAPEKTTLEDAAILDDEDSEDSYLLQPGDRIAVKVYPEDEYIKGGEMEISSEGNITLSLVGKVSVVGMSVIQAERELARLIDADYIVNPEVVIDVLKYKKQSVVILGQVKTPGTYEFPPGKTKVTLLQAISMAGGFSDIANIKKIKVMRKAGGKNEVIRANAEAIISGEEQDVDLESGDVIHVMESLF